jgi:hypothetical protein
MHRDGMTWLLVGGFICMSLFFGGFIWLLWLIQQRHQPKPAQPQGPASILRTPLHADEGVIAHQRAILPPAESSSAPFPPIAEAAGPWPAASISTIHQRPLAERKNTAAAAISRHGKTTTMNTVAVYDRLHKVPRPNGGTLPVQTVFLSTHFTFYHPVDQRIDLRPLRRHIEAYFTLETISTALDQVNRLIDQRLERYRNGGDVGHAVALYIGEHSELKEELGNEYIKKVRRIANQGLKLNIYIGFIELHSALVEEMGGGSGLRQKFHTRLAADNVDDRTWKIFTNDAPRTPTPRGWWMSDSGLVEVTPPTSDVIARIAAEPPPAWPPLLAANGPAVDTVSELRQAPATTTELEELIKVTAWLTTDPSLDIREVARRLYPQSVEKYNGGGSYAVKAKKVMQRVASVTGLAITAVTEREETASEG